MSKSAVATHTDSGLPRLVGYRELEEAFGLKRKQLDRMQADGRFPRAMHITGVGGNRRAWELKQVLEWFDAQRNRVTSLAVTDASKLKDEQLSDALSNAATEWARRSGIALPPGSKLTLDVPLSEEQLAQQLRAAAEARDQSVNQLFDAFARLDQVHAIVVAAGLMPALLPIAQHLCGVFADDVLAGTDEDRRAIALGIVGITSQRSQDDAA